MAREVVLFYEVEKSTHASQGSAPSGLPGYEIWLLVDEEPVRQDFLGWIPYDMFMTTVTSYEDQGTHVGVINLGEE